MLLNTGLTKDGEKLYQNAFTGDVTTLERAEFHPSLRRSRRGSFVKMKHHNNRKPNLHRVLQVIQTGGKCKFIIHDSKNAIARKSALISKKYGVNI